MYCVNGKYFAELYRNRISGYNEWREAELGCGFYFNADNVGPYMSLDETCLSNGDVWTFLTNKDGHGGHSRHKERLDNRNPHRSRGQIGQTQGKRSYLRSVALDDADSRRGILQRPRRQRPLPSAAGVQRGR